MAGFRGAAIVRSLLALVLGAGAAPALTACTGVEDPGPVVGRSVTVGPMTAAPSATGLVNPLESITGPDSPVLPEDDWIGPAYVEHGVGPSTFSLERRAGIESIAFYLTCEPASSFKVSTAEDRWYKADCDTRSGCSGQFPFGPGTGPIPVGVDIPEGVEFWLIGLPYETE